MLVRLLAGPVCCALPHCMIRTSEEVFTKIMLGSQPQGPIFLWNEITVDM